MLLQYIHRLRRPAVSTNKRRNPTCLIIGTVLLLSACEQADNRPTEDGEQLPTLVPRSIANLADRGQLQLRFNINNVEIHNGPWEQDFTGLLQVDASLVKADVNEITIEFSLQTTASSQPFLLASATHLLPAIQEGATVTFPAIVYQYADNDRDGRYNIHELSEVISDADEDGLLNVNDSDSDNDGTQDGMDTTPYGETTVAENTGLQRRFNAILPDGTSRTLSIDQLKGDADELSHLVDTLGSISLHTPTGWPTSFNSANPLVSDVPINDTSNSAGISTGWSAVTLSDQDRQLCPEWRLSIDASSIRSSSTQTVLLYFRRNGQAPQLLPLDATSIADLDIYDHAPPFDGNGPLNNSLRMVLVPRSTLGWIELWTDSGFNGSACSINLGTD